MTQKDFTEPINLQHELVELLKKERNEKTLDYHIPKIGVYSPSMLGQRCLRGQWNFYKMAIQERTLPDTFVLKTSEGTVWHEMIEKLDCWDSVEGRVSMDIPLEDGSKLTIMGTYDAVRGDTVYDFKRTERVPWKWTPKFEHRLQINFYMSCLGLPKGVIAYIGYDGQEFRIKEFDVVLSDWYLNTLINKAIQLHMHLTFDEPPKCTCRTKVHEVEWTEYMRRRALMEKTEKELIAKLKKKGAIEITPKRKTKASPA